MNWIYNGIVVSSIAPGQYVVNSDIVHAGVGFGRSWPLTNNVEVAQRAYDLTMYGEVRRDDGLHGVPVHDGLSMAPATITDVAFIDEYIRHCKTNDIPVQVFLCATTSSSPQMEPEVVSRLKDTSVMLGYDYISWDFDFSAIIQDLFWIPRHGSNVFPAWVTEHKRREVLDKLAAFATRLNGNGLFGDESDLLQYINTRWDIAQQTSENALDYTFGTLLETSIELWPCAVWLIHGM